MFRQLQRDSEDALTPPAQHWAVTLEEPASSLTMDVAFTDLSLQLARGAQIGQRVLSGASGRLASGNVTAVMGPSGAGKSSLLAALMGTAAGCKRSGEVRVNGVPCKGLRVFGSLVGVAPQDDVLHPLLSVEETLWFSAAMRLPRSASRAQRMLAVERAIKVLGLEDVRHSLVGNVEWRGVSGGQRKRVNIGMELAMSPCVLLADEPTSGLDSSAARDVVAALRRTARRGVTVAAVVHQPSAMVFSMFDCVLLLAKGGRVAFCGRVADIEAHFNAIGFALPARENPADWCLDVVSGSAATADGGTHPGTHAVLEAWLASDAFAKTRREGDGGSAAARALESLLIGDASKSADDGGAECQQAPRCAQPPAHLRSQSLSFAAQSLPRSESSTSMDSVVMSVEPSSAHRRTASLDFFRSLVAPHEAEALARSVVQRVVGEVREAGRDMRRALHTPNVDSNLRPAPGFAAQFGLCVYRALVQRMRDIRQLLQEWAVMTFTGLALAVVMQRDDQEIPGSVTSIANMLTAFSLLTALAGVTVFSAERVIYAREAGYVNPVAYFFAKDALECANCVVIKPLLFLAAFYSAWQPRGTFAAWYAALAGASYAVSGASYVVSIVLRDRTTAMLAAAAMALTCVLVAMQGSDQYLALQKCTFAHWALQALVIAEATQMEGVWLLTRCASLEYLGFDVRARWTCLGVMLAIGAAARLGGLFALIVRYRP